MKTRIKLVRLLVPLMALGLIAAACGDDEAPAPDTSAAEAGRRSGTGRRRRRSGRGRHRRR